MLTIKWIAVNGAEFIYEGRDIGYTPAFTPLAEPLGNKDGKSCVAFYQADSNSHVTLDCGRVFVMNDKGRTIADYLLDMTPDHPPPVAEQS